MERESDAAWTADELAGVVDLFGGLTRGELTAALSELAFREGQSADEDAVDACVEDALGRYRLVAVDVDGEEVLLSGPTAFPELPEHARDLPHILEVDQRQVDREAAGRAAERRLRAEAARAVADGDEERIATLLDASYDLEAWAPVEVSKVRRRLDDALGESER